MKTKKSNFKVLIFYAILIAAIILSLSVMFSQQECLASIDFERFIILAAL